MKFAAFLVSVLLAVAPAMIPVADSATLSKIDAMLAAGPENTEKTEVFVELMNPTVVSAATFSGSRVFTSREIMRPDNVQCSYWAKRLEFIQDTHINAVKRSIPGVLVTWQYQYAFNGYHAIVPANRILDLARFAEVKFVHKAETLFPARTRARIALGCTRIWEKIKDPKGRPVDGSGMLVGVTDSGLDYTHVDFGSQAKPVGPKVTISRDFAYKDDDCQEEENMSSAGHGTSCAGIIAGDGPFNKALGIEEKGLAPKALLAGYKIGTKDKRGFSANAIMAAWESNIKDKVDVSNNSYSGSGGRPVYAVAQENCMNAGVVVVASQGNDGTPGPFLSIPSGTTSSPSTVISVGALDDTEAARLRISHAEDPEISGKLMQLHVGNTGVPFNSGEAFFEIVDCGWGRLEDFSGIDVKGKIALIQRGPSAELKDKFGEALSYKDKCLNAARNGARAVILYNYNTNPIRAQYYDPTKEDPKKLGLLPSFHLYSYGQGMAIRTALHAGNDWERGQVDRNQNLVKVVIADIGRRSAMAGYSSSGPSFSGFLKPDVSAPADETHTTAATFLKKNYGLYKDTFNGTSAAGPMVAGCATLIKQGRPEWNPYEIKRALMNTAEPLKRLSGDYYIPMVMQGMGRVNAQAAITSDLLFQPSSTLIAVKTGQVNMTDPAQEIADKDYNAVPPEVSGSKVPVRIANYSGKKATVELSFEVNSARPDLINVSLTSTSVVVPPAVGGNPGFAWVGVDVSYPTGIKGRLNDVYIWATDKTANRRWHIGICLYNMNPGWQGLDNKFINEVEIGNPVFSPDGSKGSQKLEATYEVTCGNFDGANYDNYQQRMLFYAADINREAWVLIKEEPFLEMGPHSLVWDGKDSNGKFVLPDGQWQLKVYSPAVLYDGKNYVSTWLSSIPDDSGFMVAGSPAPQPPILSAAISPLEPGANVPFELAVNIANARNVKTMEFALRIDNPTDPVNYAGFDKGDFMVGDDPLAQFEVGFDKEKRTVNVSVKRAVDGVSGEGCIVRLNFVSREANYVDFTFSSLNLTMVDENGKEAKVKGSWKDAAVVVLEKAYLPSDFNRDGSVDIKDMEIILSCLGAKDGDPGYKWRCDLNFDRLVDMADMVIFAHDFMAK